LNDAQKRAQNLRAYKADLQKLKKEQVLHILYHLHVHGSITLNLFLKIFLIQQGACRILCSTTHYHHWLKCLLSKPLFIFIISSKRSSVPSFIAFCQSFIFLFTPLSFFWLSVYCPFSFFRLGFLSPFISLLLCCYFVSVFRLMWFHL
jgi:hypothetical protein